MIQRKYEVYYNLNDYFHDRFQARYGEAFWKTCEIVQHIWAEQQIFRLFRDAIEIPER
jgi:hypothetical protein